MTQDNIYSAEDGHFIARRTIHVNEDSMYVILEGKPFECMLNEENNKFEV